MTPSMVALLAMFGMSHPIRVLDVGANPIEGDPSYKALLDAGHATVTGFEPQAEALAALNAAKSANETYLPDALGDGQNHDLHLYHHSGFTSIFPPDAGSADLLGFGRSMTVTGSIALPTRKLDDIAEIIAIDFLKIDVQGSELSILRNGRAKLKDCLVIQTEVRLFPLYDGEPTFGDLSAELTNQGFQFFRFHTMKHALLSRGYRKKLRRSEFGQAVDGDAFFVRDLRLIGQLSNDHLIRLAIIAGGIMASCDLTLFCLGQLVQRSVITTAQVDGYYASLPGSAVRGS